MSPFLAIAFAPLLRVEELLRLRIPRCGGQVFSVSSCFTWQDICSSLVCCLLQLRLSKCIHPEEESRLSPSRGEYLSTRLPELASSLRLRCDFVLTSTAVSQSTWQGGLWTAPSYYQRMLCESVLTASASVADPAAIAWNRDSSSITRNPRDDSTSIT